VIRSGVLSFFVTKSVLFAFLVTRSGFIVTWSGIFLAFCVTTVSLFWLFLTKSGFLAFFVSTSDFFGENRLATLLSRK